MARGCRYGGRVEAIGRWWDGVELWVTGLPFALQALVVMVVLVPLCALVATWADIALSKAFGLFGRGEGAGAQGSDAEKTDVDAPQSTGSGH